MATFIDLEFDTAEHGGAPLGDIASSLVSLNDLLRDLAAMAAYPSSAEFREIQVVAIQMRSPLTVKLSLLAISAEAVKAFQDICRDIILVRKGREEADATRLAKIRTMLERVLLAEGNTGHIDEKEIQRVYGHVVSLLNAQVPLKRVVVKEEPAR